MVQFGEEKKTHRRCYYKIEVMCCTSKDHGGVFGWLCILVVLMRET